jgi:hypothetical protein
MFVCMYVVHRYACEAVNDYGHDVAMWIVCVGSKSTQERI